MLFVLILFTTAIYKMFIMDNSFCCVTLSHQIYHQLIEANLAQRITSLEQLQKEPVYEADDWDTIVSQRATPPYLPPVSLVFCLFVPSTFLDTEKSYLL